MTDDDATDAARELHGVGRGNNDDRPFKGDTEYWRQTALRREWPAWVQRVWMTTTYGRTIGGGT